MRGREGKAQATHVCVVVAGLWGKRVFVEKMLGLISMRTGEDETSKKRLQ